MSVIFGIPGIHNLSIYEELDRFGIRCITPRHEQGAGYAADGYARTTGSPGVVVTTTGPAVINAATALAQAYSDSSPVLLISPGVPTDHPRQGRGYLHETKDQSRAIDSLCAWSHRVMSVAEIPAAVARAFALFAEGRPRPVHVEIPVDLLEREARVAPAPPYRMTPRRPDPDALEAGAMAMAAAVRPGIVLGGGAQRPQEPEPPVGRLALELAGRVGALIVTTANGKGVVPETHPLSLGATLHLESVRNWLAGCDVVLAVGTELGPSDLWVEDFRLSGTLIRADVDPGQMYGDHVADVPIIADAALAVRGLRDRVMSLRATPPLTPLAPPRRAVELAESTRRWAPYLDALRTVLPRSAIVAADNSAMCYHGAIGGLSIEPPGRFLLPTGYGTLGFALPAGIGAKIGRPDRPVVVLAGDGALQFSVQELATAVELGLNIPIIVSLNGGYGEIRSEMKRRGMTPLAVDLHAPDFRALALAYGARGHQVDTPRELGEAVVEALAAPVPTIILFQEDE